MDLELKGKAAIVTGASRGIGNAIARVLAEEGVALAICSRNRDEIEAAGNEIGSRFGVRVYREAVDLAEPEAPSRFFRNAAASLGPIEIVVNNVGGGASGDFEKLKGEDWERVYRQNFAAARELCRAALPGMRERGRGKIVNVAALSGKIPRLGQIASNTAKAALISLTQSLACEYGRYGIRCNAVCPAVIVTGRWQQRLRRAAEQAGKPYDEFVAAFARERVPAGRLGSPEDVAHLVAFLASPKSDFVHGAAIEVDGGFGRCVEL
jgi:3-oxoacyl-[acyl-carrier protein] reductase